MRPNPLALAMLAGTVFAAGACVSSDQDTVIVILQNNPPADGCLSNVDTSAAFIARGIVDTNSPNGYMLSPIVTNTASTTNSTTSQLYLLEGADITLTPQSGFFTDGELAELDMANQLSFSQRFSGVVEPDGGITFMVFEIIGTPFLDAVAAKLPADGTKLQVKASIQIFGQLHGGELKSQKFGYWVDVCNGCLAPVDLGTCDSVPDGYVAGQGSCWGLQDSAVECCTDASGATICPATGPASGT